QQVAVSLPKISDDHDLIAASLDPLLHDSDVGTRSMAFESLLNQGEPGAQTLIRLLDDSDDDVRRRAANGLARTPGEYETTQALRRVLDDKVPEVRTAALRSLYQHDAIDFQDRVSMIGETKLRAAAIGLLLQLQRDAGPGESLEELRQAVPLLRELLKSDDSETVIDAIHTLAGFGPAAREASKELIALADELERRMKTADGRRPRFSPWWAH